MKKEDDFEMRTLAKQIISDTFEKRKRRKEMKGKMFMFLLLVIASAIAYFFMYLVYMSVFADAIGNIFKISVGLVALISWFFIGYFIREGVESKGITW